MRYSIVNASIDNLRRIVDEQQCLKFKWASSTNRRAVLIDMYTAQAIVKVYDAVGDDAKQKMERMVAHNLTQFERVASFALSKVMT